LNLIGVDEKKRAAKKGKKPIKRPPKIPLVKAGGGPIAIRARPFFQGRGGHKRCGKSNRAGEKGKRKIYCRTCGGTLAGGKLWEPKARTSLGKCKSLGGKILKKKAKWVDPLEQRWELQKKKPQQGSKDKQPGSLPSKGEKDITGFPAKKFKLPWVETEVGGRRKSIQKGTDADEGEGGQAHKKSSIWSGAIPRRKKTRKTKRPKGSGQKGI